MLDTVAKILREKKGLSQNALAKKVGIHRATLFRFEKGEKSVSEKMAANILSSLGLSRKTIYRVMVVSELLRLKKAFKETSADEQIEELLLKFKMGSKSERVIFDIFKKAVNKKI